MKNHTVLFLLLFTASTQATELSLVRNSFYSASLTSEVCEDVYNKIKNKDYSDQPIMMGYKGVYQVIMAKHAWNPFSKWNYFKSGVAQLEQAIAKRQNSIELIFLRFSIQTNSPSFMGYTGQIKSDKAFIMKSIMNKTLRNKYSKFLKDTVNYLVQSPFLTQKEKLILKNIEFKS